MLCGSTLRQRDQHELEGELAHITWLLTEFSRWDNSLAPEPARRVLREFYETQRTLLTASLTAVSASTAAPIGAAQEPPASTRPPTESPKTPEVELRPTPDAPTSTDFEPQQTTPVVETPTPTPPRTTPARAQTLRAPRVLPRPPQPSAWERLWKPIIGESLGWFIGAFLILAGTFAYLAGEWGSMSDASRALTVFGMAVFWSLGFAGWGRLLTRREATRPASVILFRISAAVAPLATIALGPVVTQWFAWPLVALQTALATLLARHVVKQRWATVGEPRANSEAGVVALSIALATLTLGVAPVLPIEHLMWLELGPVLLAAVVYRKGPVDAQLTRFSLATLGYAVGLLAVRMHVAALAAGLEAPWGVHAVTLSALAAAALELRQHTRRAADQLMVLTVALQSLVLVPAASSAAPAFVLAAVIAAVTTARLARREGPAEVPAARWLVPTYVFAYAAFQRIDQLVPPAVKQWYYRLVEALGYTPHSLPPSYASVYAAFFVVGVGVWAGVALERARTEGQRVRASVLLSCTTWGAVAFGALALASLASDARPALIALPVLLVTTLALGFWHRRVDLLRASAALSVATGVTLAVSSHLAWPVAMLALGVALVSLIALEKPRQALSAAALALVLLSVSLSFKGAAHPEHALALVFATAAALLVARNLDNPTVLAAAFGVPLLLFVRFSEPWVLGVAALLYAGALPSKASRLNALWPSSVVAAVVACMWHVDRTNDWPTVTLALAAATQLVGSLRRRASGGGAMTHVIEGMGLVFALLALAPLSRAYDFYRPWHAQWAACALAAGASVAAVRGRRSWQGVVLASGAIILALACAPWVHRWHEGMALASVVALAATPALLASVTVPLAAAAACLVFVDTPNWLLAVAVVTSLLALLEEIDFGWNVLLNRSAVAWAGTVSAALVIALALVLGADSHGIGGLLVILPLAWVRATRSTVWFSVGVALASGSLLRPAGANLGAVDLAVLVPLSALFFSRATLESKAFVRLLGVTTGPNHSLLLVTIAGGLAVGLAAPELAPIVTAAWLAALLLFGGDWLAVNFVGVAVVACVVPPAQPGAIVALLTIALGLRHATHLTQRVIGGVSSESLLAAPALSAAGLAVVSSVVTGGALAQSLLGASLLTSGLLLGLWPLAASAIALAGVDVHESLRLFDLTLLPWAPWVALVAAAAAVCMRHSAVDDVVQRLWLRLGRDPKTAAATPWWWGAALLLALSLPHASWPWLVVGLLLFVTPLALESAIATSLTAGAVVLMTPHETAALALGAGGAVLTWLGAWRYEREPAARSWFHFGWLLALASLVVVGGQLSHPALPTVWVLAAVTAWGVAWKQRLLEWGAWALTWVAAHVAVAHLGERFSTGAPQQLIVPWFGLASALLAATALSLARENTVRRFSGLALGGVSLLELFMAMSWLDSPYPREAGVALVAGVLLVTSTGWRIVRFDDAWAAWLGQATVVISAVTLRRLGAGVSPGIFEAWAAMTWGAVVWGLALFLGREGRTQSARALRAGAVMWPLLGLLAMPWQSPSHFVLLLLVQAGHYAWLARTGLRRVGAGLSAIAFNGAMIAAFFATGWHGVQDLALPAGLSVLALTSAFRHELPRDAQVKLRAVAMTAIYAAAAWRPLTFTTSLGLIFCVVVCLVGIGAGAFLRIRSFVLLGTAFLVTSVVATLIRQGLAEPRLGAALLAALGLGIVAFMVVFTTRRAELQARFAALKTLLEQWEG